MARLRRLGATKIQIGYQSLDDEVLRLNRRGHDTAATRRAMRLLRGAGFKVQAHWMPNLYGSDPERDLLDYERIFGDPAYRPDELKLYPTSLVETAELMEKFLDGIWRPYETGELTRLLEECLLRTPPYCRLSRVIRDIPSTDIVEGNKITNLREAAEAGLAARGLRSADIRAREIRGRAVRREELRLAAVEYETAGSRRSSCSSSPPTIGSPASCASRYRSRRRRSPSSRVPRSFASCTSTASWSAWARARAARRSTAVSVAS